MHETSLYVPAPAALFYVRPVESGKQTTCLPATPGGLLSRSIQSSGYSLGIACLFTCFALMKLALVFFLLLLPAKLFCYCCCSPYFISSSLMFLHVLLFAAAVMKLKQLFSCSWNIECFCLLLVDYWRGVYWPSPFKWASSYMLVSRPCSPANWACTVAYNC